MAFTINSGGTTGTPTLASLSASGGMQGQTVMETVTGTGFTAPATVAVSGTGITVSNTTVVNSTTITVTFTIAANAPTGAQNVTVTTAGGTSNTLTFMVTMAAPPPPADFTISAAPSSQTVTQGANTSYTVTIAPVNGFNGNVILSESGLPTPQSFTPPSVTGGSGTSTLTVVTMASTPTGTFTFTVTGTSGSLIHNTTTTLVVNAPPPPSPGVFFTVTNDNGDNNFPFTSFGDPFVSFTSFATNLVPNDTNNALDVFVACIVGGATTSCPAPVARVSLTSSGGQIPGGAGPAPPTGPLQAAPISGDGRFVAFGSSDPNVVTPPTNGSLQIYVRDTCAGAPAGCMPTTFLAAQSTTGVRASQNSSSPSISSNGRVVAFMSGDFNLAPPASGFQIYARDTCFGASVGCTPSTRLVSADNSGLQGIIFQDHPSASGDGRFVAFESSSGNLVVPPVAGMPLQIFERDTCIGAPAGCVPSTVLISVNMTGTPSNNFNQNPSVDGDGRFVVFTSQASDILPGNTAAGRPDVFVRDTCRGSSGPVAGCMPSTTRVSQALSGTQADNQSGTPTGETSISLNGRFIAFGSFATNLLPTVSTPGQIYALDTCLGAPAGCTRTLNKVTVDSTGAEVGSSGQFSLSGDGSYVAFTRLIGVAPNQIQQIFLAFTGF